MELLRQAKEDEACALYSIAMVTGLSIVDVTLAAGHYGRMSLPQIRKTLDKLGFGTNTYSAEGSNLPGRGILILYTTDLTDGHAVAYEDKRIFDCDNDTIFYGITELLLAYNNNDSRGKTWFASRVMPVFPLKTREFAVGKKEEQS
jgi:hypothetical protein